MRSGASAAALAVALLSLLAGGSLIVPATAMAAKLVGGPEQASIRRAFDASAAHRRQLIVSIRTSTISPRWAVVQSVTPQRAGRTGPGASTPRLSSSFYQRVGGSERAGSPPGAVRADLKRAFQIAVVFTGSGSESIGYAQAYRSACAGDGGFNDTESDTVRPMSWSVRYVVDLDDVLAAARSAQGTVLVPEVSFAAADSTLDATESLTRTVQDLGCNGSPTTFHCTETFHPGGADPAGQLSLATSGGIDVGVPMRASMSGACQPDEYTLGPSLWDGGAVTADAAKLGLIGGAGLPADPYAPVRVSWPGNSGPQTQQFVSSPCQGDPAVCQDTFQWRGTVRLAPVS